MLGRRRMGAKALGQFTNWGQSPNWPPVAHTNTAPTEAGNSPTVRPPSRVEAVWEDLGQPKRSEPSASSPEPRTQNPETCQNSGHILVLSRKTPASVRSAQSSA
ncbi:hypothetical protein ILYODFUR_033861 [Ilyodon furcidens]|uniref:Uncharacterized protein n=1 Tax=Ilyodon furcidens TaxID=33524 RepID=A0ABV0UXF1_9TELE